MSTAPTPAPVLNDAVISAAIKEGFGQVESKWETKSAEQKAALVKEILEVHIPAAVVKSLPDALAGPFAEHQKAVDRLLKERTARPPGVLTGDGMAIELRSIGMQVASSELFKAWNANDRNRERLSVTIKSRLLTPSELKAVTIAGSGVTIAKYSAPLVTPVQQPLVMRDLLPVTPITANAIDYQIISFTGNADYQVAEGDKKAELGLSYAPKTASVRTIAGFFKASRQMLADVPGVAATIDNQLLYAIAFKEDTEILFGDNAAGHLHGIMPQAPAVPAGVIADQDNPADQIMAGLAYLASLGFPPNGIVINPLDWASVQTAKLPNGQYMLGGPPAAFPGNTLWGISTVTTPAMPRGSFLVGNFTLGATLFDRETATTEIATENEDDFVRNMVTIRGEERIALAVFRPNAFAKGTLTFATGGATTRQENTKGGK